MTVGGAWEVGHSDARTGLLSYAGQTTAASVAANCPPKASTFGTRSARWTMPPASASLEGSLAS